MIEKLPTLTLHAEQTRRISGKLFRILRYKVNMTNSLIKILDNVDKCFFLDSFIKICF